MGNWNCCVSVSASDTDPMAANIEAYMRYPPMKYKQKLNTNCPICNCDNVLAMP